MKKVDYLECHCGKCRLKYQVSFPGGPYACRGCQTPLIPFGMESIPLRLEHCPVCGCPNLYRIKNFDRKWGLAILGVGIFLSFYTYGLSLLLVTLIDWFLYSRVREIGTCYQCEAKFHNFPDIAKLLVFDLILYDHYRSRVQV